MIRRLIGLLALANLLFLAMIMPAATEERYFPELKALTGTLRKVHDSGVIVLGYRESSLPFSYLTPGGLPIGYSLDLCGAIVDAVAEETEQPLRVEYRPVTPENRIPSLLREEIDLECGSTTNNPERREQVAFSPITFVAGTRLLVRRADRIRSYKDLRGKTIVVTAATTNEAAVRELSRRQKLDLRIVTTPEHQRSFDLFRSGEATAFASDDILLYGFLAHAGTGDEFSVFGDLLSYDPYGIMYRRNDADLAAVIEQVFGRLAVSGELVWTYNRWFLRRLPTGERLNVPISPQLDDIWHALGASG